MRKQLPQLEDRPVGYVLVLPTNNLWARRGTMAALNPSFRQLLRLCVAFAALHVDASLQHGPCQSRTKFLSSAATPFLASVPFAPSRSSAVNEVGEEMKTSRWNAVERGMRMAMSDEKTKKNPRTRGFFLQRFTGDSTPFSFPVQPVRLVHEWPEMPPFDPEDFSRMDGTDDRLFYGLPKLVYHIDEPAVAALTQYYRNNIKEGSDILDICSSWVSHYPLEFPDTMGKICGTGMSDFELKNNDQLTGGYKQADLNSAPVLDYADNSFDVVTCVVSIDYLVSPIQVLKEVHRILRPRGKMIVSQSNRCFPTKAIKMWLDMNDRQRLELINAYFQYAGGFEPRKAFDITADVPGGGYHDPMFIVEAVKES